jgi:hypothetical protein
MDRLFGCCCVSNTGQHEQMIGGAPVADACDMAFPRNSPMPQFPGAVQASERNYASKEMQNLSPATAGAGWAEAQDSGSIRGDESPGLNGGDSALASARTDSSSMPAEEKEREKAKLQRLVKDFAKEAVTGIAVHLLSAETARKSPHFFQMDRHLTVFSIRPKDGSTAETAVQDFDVRDLTAIYKGADVAAKCPSLGVCAGYCVGLDTIRADRSLFIYFEDAYERDKFYTCLKILRMSVDIVKPG